MQSGSTPQVADYFSDLQLPNVNDMELQLNKLVQQGVITPEQAQAQLTGRSEMDNVSTDPNDKKAQMAALAGLQDISNSGGMTAEDKANLSHIQTDEDTAARGKRDAIIQNAQSRGLGGSGLELMSQMQNQQDSATRQSQRDLDVAGQAQNRALQALIQGGQLGGQMQAQDFNQQAQKAGANDAIAKFNAQNKQNVNLTNVANNNNAQAMNLQNKQNIANQNVALSNSQQQYNKQLAQQNFDNEMKKRGGQAGIAQGNAANAGADSRGAAGAFNNTIGTGISAVTGLYGANLAANAAAKKNSDNSGGFKDGGMIGGEPTSYDSQHIVAQPGEMVIKKDDVPHVMKMAHTDEKGDFDVAGFLDQITGHKYGYKKKGKR